MPTINDKGTEIWYEVTGSGQPLVLTGGFGLLHNQWDFVRESLAARYQVIDWNYRGAGRSDRAWPGGSFNQDTWVDDLEIVLNELNIDSAVLWGTSTGSPISVRYTAKYQHRVKALVTYPMFKADASFRNAFEGFRFIGETFGYDALACLTSWIGCAEANVFNTRQGEIAKWEAACFAQNFSLSTLAETMRIVATNDFTSDVAKIKCPTLLLMGESGHLGYGEEGNRNLAKEFLTLAPHATLKLIAKGGGTYCMIEEPETTVLAIIEFIDGLQR
jgi:pimeloyl-ACP methyl ester carboxylesterase